MLGKEGDGAAGLNSFFWERTEMVSPLGFLNFFAPGSGRIPVVMMIKEKLVGLLMIADCQKEHRCSLGIWIAPAYRGVNSHWLSIQCLLYCHNSMGIENVFAASPWPHSQKLMERTGMLLVGRAPRYFKKGDRQLDLKMYASIPKRCMNFAYKYLINTGPYYHDETARNLLLYGVKANAG